METLLNFLRTYSMYFIKTLLYTKQKHGNILPGLDNNFFTTSETLLVAKKSTSKHTDPTSNQILHKMYASYYYKCVNKIIKTVKCELSYKVLLSGNSAL
jgi:hypothetical protein